MTYNLNATVVSKVVHNLKHTRAIRHNLHRERPRVCSDSTDTNNIPTLGGATIAFIIVSQFSRYCCLWMLKSTKQVTSVVKKWLQTTIKQKHRLRTDPNSAILYWKSDIGPEFPRNFTTIHMFSKYDIDYRSRTHGIQIFSANHELGIMHI